MRIGLISDTHDAADRTRRALELLEARGAEVLVHAGDLTSGKLVPLFDGWEVYLVEGNGDWPEAIEAAIEENDVDVRYAETHAIELGGTRLGVLHGAYDGRLATAIERGGFDVVVHGHTHAFRDEEVGATRVINPGAVFRTPSPSVGVLDVSTGTLERIGLDA